MISLANAKTSSTRQDGEAKRERKENEKEKKKPKLPLPKIENVTCFTQWNATIVELEPGLFLTPTSKRLME